MKHVIITGGAGFIGSTLAEELLTQGYKVTVVDNFDPFYDEQIKRRNIEAIMDHPNFKFLAIDICNLQSLTINLIDDYDVIVHTAARAGVHMSIKEPIICQQINVLGTQNLLEIAKAKNIKQFVFASSSSVYGVNPKVPWSESDPDLMPISPYASSKLSSELLGHVYTHLHGIRFIALRFFTVYGPKQRPDLAIYKFTRKILNGEPIPMFGDGSTRRDYTYVDDTVAGVISAINYDKSNFEIINLGNGRTVSLQEMIATIENVFDRKAKINQLPMQPGDVPQTYADIDKARKLLNYNPQHSFKEGIEKFKSWLISSKTLTA